MVGAVLAAFIVYLGWDLLRASSQNRNCSDGPRQTIDIRDFTTKYWAYSFDLQATIANKAKFSAKIAPVAVQQLSESLQSADQFRKALVAGYNSCAITRADYGRDLKSFQALDGLARQINVFATKPDLSQGENAQLERLVKQYNDLVERLGTSQ